jgi:preprotein translocase subunit YajC
MLNLQIGKNFMLNSILLQVAGSNMSSLFLIVGMFVIMYFFMIRPQQKKQKEQQSYVDSLKAGDKVVTIGGAHGTIVSVREKTVVLEVDASKGVRIVFLKTSISKDASSQLTAE